MIALADFLLARIAEDEAQALVFSKCSPASYETDGTAASPEYVTVYVSPARVLAECEAKRRIVSRCDMVLRGREHGMFNGGQAVDANDNLRALAQVYADHPDYQPDWALTESR